MQWRDVLAFGQCENDFTYRSAMVARDTLKCVCYSFTHALPLAKQMLYADCVLLKLKVSRHRVSEISRLDLE